MLLVFSAGQLPLSTRPCLGVSVVRLLHSRGLRRELSGVKVLLLNFRSNYLRLLAGGCSRGFEVHAPRLRNGVRMQARTPALQLLKKVKR